MKAEIPQYYPFPSFRHTPRPFPVKVDGGVTRLDGVHNDTIQQSSLSPRKLASCAKPVYDVPGKWPRGRPKQRWLDTLLVDLKMSSLDDSELARLEKELLDDVEVPTRSPGPRIDDTGDSAHGRKKRKHSSSNSSSSACSESSCSSYSSSDSEDPCEQDILRNARAEELKKKYNPESPLASRPIPKKIDFVGAVKEAPEIARMEYKKLRVRVDINAKFLEHFNKCAAGVYVGTEERLNFYDRLPLVSSGLAAPPVLDEGLPRKSFRIQVDEASLFADAEVLLNALNLMAIALLRVAIPALIYTSSRPWRWSAPSIDLFASRWNAKCSKFFSFLPDPNASGVDAFAQEWSGIYGYAFPPFNMVGRVIRKALREGAHLILVCPKWKNQSWWPLVLEHGKEITPLKSTQDMLMDVNGLPHPCLSRPTFQLIACTI
ncbi:unnamed protein product [Heligmosomoides polygyrus]|uniref:ULP_PROTEASE domain-containing protein n=1 Tax=Heligmosomoides polygyrus TaxID=6339 RepID=A0A3P8BUV4_HELPZ|nr:unnamed protein product [Heligmosomoides polygyrus]